MISVLSIAFYIRSLIGIKVSFTRVTSGKHSSRYYDRTKGFTAISITVWTNKKNILYAKLYSSTVTQINDLPVSDDLFFREGNDLILDEVEQNLCEDPLTETECLESLKSMESNKSPGSDGLPAEFYKVFWKDIKRHLLNALNYAYLKGLLSITQRRGLITLIPKKSKSTNLMKDCRVIALVTCDYKIATKYIGSRNPLRKTYIMGWREGLVWFSTSVDKKTWGQLSGENN